jgi:dolichyl-phosphate-mannose-protein mannosyltransferase
MLNKCTRVAIAILLLCMLIPAVSVNAASNLLRNASFEQVTGDVPDEWGQEAYLQEDNYTVYSLSGEQAHTGMYSVKIENKEANHARWTQTVQVSKKSVYKISGYIRTEGVGADATGAHLFVEGIAAEYPQIKDSGGKWEYLEFYAKTGAEQDSITLGASLGGYGAINTGTAYFDDLSVEKVAKAPSGATVIALTSGESGAPEQQPLDGGSVLSMLLSAAMFCVMFTLVSKRLLRPFAPLELPQQRRQQWLALLFGAGLLLRLVIGVTHPGYLSDMGLFKAWSDRVFSVGITEFYYSGMFVDYPPGYMYVLYLLGALKSLLGLDSASNATLLLFKLPAIAADMIAAYVVFAAASKRTSFQAAAGLALLYLFNPAVIIDSAAWGQVDSVFSLVLVLAIAGIVDNKIRRASVWFAIAALVKPQAFIFMPVLLLWFIYRRAWKQIPLSALYGFGTFLLLGLPFFLAQGGLPDLYELYKGTLSSYPHATINAFNLYALADANWRGIDEKWVLFTFRTWGNMFIAAAVIVASWFAVKKQEGETSSRSFFIAMILIVIVFVGVTKMHERYMFPVLLLGLMAFVQALDKRLLYIYLGFSLTNFINYAYVLDFSKTTTNVPLDGIVLLVSLANCVLMLYTVYVGYDLYWRGRVKPLAPYKEGELVDNDYAVLDEYKSGAAKEAKRTRMPLARKDWIWIGSITLVYAIVALYHLGNLSGPQTAWQPGASGQSFYVDLGEVKQLDRVNSFGGVGTGKYKYEFSQNGTDWDNLIEVDSNHVAVFAWKSQAAALSARYVKLTAVEAGFSMHELAIYEQGNKTPLTIVDINDEQAAEAKRGSVALLFDEQSLAQYEGDYMNGSYFDEIYHARTAYEHLEHIVAYENTHPPLGKIIIALGIKLFGVTPFGWRIAGTLFGIAMLPLMYLFARRLFRSSLYAGIATLLFAVDFMHFTQTRISTIDVYGVFFILLMFYFMHKYYTLNFYTTRLRTTLWPLFLAGLFFGIGVASKWIVLYGGAGLAVMLGLSLFERYKEYAAAKRVLRGEGDKKLFAADRLEHIVKQFPRSTIITLAVCLIFYIAIPLAIYALSYIPVLTVMKDGYTLKSFIDYQKNMFSYHSNLVSTHPFSSSWWEWPFMKRPVWYYSGDNLAEGMKSTIVAMGNPAIWWTGIFAMGATLWMSIKRRDKAMYTLWIAFLAQYVPWMLVTRLTFLYHYFAMVPFIILAIVYMFKVLEERNVRFKLLRHAVVASAVLLFIMFYPALSGMTVSASYVNNVLRWFPSWLF